MSSLGEMLADLQEDKVLSEVKAWLASGEDPCRILIVTSASGVKMVRIMKLGKIRREGD